MLKRNPWPVILQVIPELHTGGAERTTIEVAEAIRKAGGRALVLSAGGSLERDLADAGGEFLRFPAKTKNPAAILMNAMRMQRIIQDYQVSLVHARSRAPAWSALIAARRTGRVFVTTYHGIYGQKGRLKAWYNGVMARGDAVIANSEYTATTIRSRHAIPEERLHVIPRGVDLRQFSPEAVRPERVEALRAAWGVESQERVVLLAGRLTRWKGQHLLIEAIARTNAAKPLTGVKVILAGDDQGRDGYRASLRSMIGELGLTHLVRLVGHCRDMPAAYRASDIAVVSSIEDEAFGRVSIEAQAMGCPVVASCCGALPETMGLPHAPDLEDGVARVECGWLFRCNDGLALARALEQALALSPDERRDMGRNAATGVAASFSTSALQTRTLEVYDQLLGTQLARSFKAYAAP